MGTFSSNFDGFHLFISNDPVLEHLGISNYTVKSIRSYLSNDQKLKNLNKLTAQDKTAQQWEDYFFGADPTQKKAILKFDENAGRYRYQNIDDNLLDLIESHEEIQIGTVNLWERESDLKDIFDIQNSASGALTIEYSGADIFPLTTEADIKPSARLYLQFRNSKKVAKIVAQKSPIIVDVPKKSDGGRYSYRLTIDEQGTNIGGFYPPIEGYDEDNQVAGKLRLHFNRALGMWESGTQQILARLLTDIDPAAVTAVSIDDIDNASVASFYDTDSDLNMSAFTIGLALPLSVHNGNPHTFGPHINVSKDQQTGDVKNKKDKIRVVNRAPRAFTKNSIVICSLIDSEWIIQDFGEIQEVEKPAKIGSWQFSKFFANSDSYFQPDLTQALRYANDINFNTTFISPNIYESQMRSRFYWDLRAGTSDGDNFGSADDLDTTALDEFNIDFQKLATINFSPTLSAPQSTQAAANWQMKNHLYTYMLSKQYFASTIFDQVNDVMGGTGAATVLRRTNPAVGVGGNETVIDIDLNNITTFWGPLFTEGYNAGQVTRLNNLPGSFEIKFSGVDSSDSSELPESSTLRTYFTAGSIIKDYKDTGSAYIVNETMFDDESDINLKQLPAEIACNGPFGEGVTAPIEDFPSMFHILNGSIPERQNMVEATSRYINNPYRYAWLGNDDPEATTPAYGLEPVNPANVTFSLCQLEFALHSDKYLKAELLDDLPKPDFFEQYRSILREEYRSEDHFFGRMFERLVGDFRSPPPFDTIRNCGLFNTNAPSVPNDFFVVPWGCMVKRAGNPRLEVPNIEANYSFDYFSELFGGTKSTGSQLQGIISAKNTIYKKKGGIINIGVLSFFGVTPTSVNIGNIINRYWGNSLAENIQDFGTAAAYIRVFDAWPKEQTLHDPRYFGVLHFNKGKCLSAPTKKRVGNTIQPLNFIRDVDEENFDIDFRVPTYGAIVTENEDGSINIDTSNDNTIVPVGTTLNRNTQLRPKSEWRVNTIRRGMLLPFRYEYTTIGYNNLSEYLSNGTGFVLNQEVNVGNAIFKITQVNQEGGITGLAFKQNVDGFLERGYNVDPESFNDPHPEDESRLGLILTIQNSNPEGEDAEVFIENAIAYNRISTDIAPKEQVLSKRLIPSSQNGDKSIEDFTTIEFTLEQNSVGAYDCFYHISNDVGINAGIFEQVPSRSPYQYINIQIK